MSKTIRKWVGVLSVVLFLAACGDATSEKPKETAKPVIQSVKVATEVPYPPFEYEENGEFKGFDMDIIRAIGKEIGWKVEIQKETFDDVFKKVENGTYDIGISSITASDERKEKHGFSEPYFTTYQLIVVDKGFKVTSLKELKGKKIAVQEGTTGYDMVVQELGKKGSKITTYPDMEQAINAFIKGKVDAMVGDNAFILDYLKHSDFTDYALIRDENITLEQLGIMTKKENQALLNELNRGIGIIQENGVYDAIYDQYFGN